jgi:hypothetical protein
MATPRNTSPTPQDPAQPTAQSMDEFPAPSSASADDLVTQSTVTIDAPSEDPEIARLQQKIDDLSGLVARLVEAQGPRKPVGDRSPNWLVSYNPNAYKEAPGTLNFLSLIEQIPVPDATRDPITGVVAAGSAPVMGEHHTLRPGLQRKTPDEVRRMRENCGASAAARFSNGVITIFAETDDLAAMEPGLAMAAIAITSDPELLAEWASEIDRLAPMVADRLRRRDEELKANPRGANGITFTSSSTPRFAL